MDKFEEQYLDLLQYTLKYGTKVKDRTGVGTIYGFGRSLEFEVGWNDFPLLTTRKMTDFWKYEYIAFVVKNSTNIKDFDKYAHIWKPWANDEGELGPTYGKQIAKQFPAINDQIYDIINKNEGYEKWLRRLVMTMWNADDLDKMLLNPCHGTSWQLDINDDKKEISLFTHQRSADIVLGLPSNVAYYSLWLIDIVEQINEFLRDVKGYMRDHYSPGKIHYTLGNYHIYLNQLDGVQEQLTRDILPAPSITLLNNPIQKVEDIQIEDYNFHPFIKFPAAAV